MVTFLFFWLFFCLFFGLFPFPQAASKTPEVTTQSLQQNILKEFQRHNFKKVIRLYTDFKEQQPDQYIPFAVRISSSQALAETGDIEGAIQIITEAIRDLPSEVNATKLHYDLANLLFIEKRYDEAEVLYQKILLMAAPYHEIEMKARERLTLMKGREGRKKDQLSLQLLDIEMALEGGAVPDGAVAFLKEIEMRPKPVAQAERIKKLLEKIQEINTAKSQALLDEARRVFDEEKNYPEVREILEQILREYPDVCDKPSVEALMKVVDARQGKASLAH